MGVVDNNRIGVGDVESRFNDGGAEQHVVLASDEVEHDFLQFIAFHLAMGYSDTASWYVTRNEVMYIHDVLHSVMDEEDLTVSSHLEEDGFADELTVEGAELSLYRIAVGRRRVDDTEVAGAHHRELECSRNRCGGQCQRIHVGFHLLEFFLHGNAELLFLIDDK